MLPNYKTVCAAAQRGQAFQSHPAWTLRRSVSLAAVHNLAQPFRVELCLSVTQHGLLWPVQPQSIAAAMAHPISPQ